MADCLLPYEWPGSYFIGKEEKDAVLSVLEARSPYRFFGHEVQGYCDKVEQFFMKRLGRKYALLVNSGSSALFVSLIAAGVGPGDEVLVPGYCWVACWSSVVRCGAIPRLVDINDTFTLDPADLESKINQRTKALLAVHMSGTCGDLEKVLEVCKKHGVFVIEDCAQSNGAYYKGKPLGSFGQMAIFSFQFNKNITAGEGGIIVCDDETLAQRTWALHEQGYARNAQGKTDWTIAPQLWGYCTHMNEITAAVLYAQTGKLDKVVSTMRQRNHWLYNGLKDVPGVHIRRVNDPGGDSGPFVLFYFDTEEICREMVALTRSAGVKPGPQGAGNIRLTDWGLHIYYHNAALVQKLANHHSGRPWTDPLNSFHKEISYEKGTLPVCDNLVERGVLLTVPPALTEDTCKQIVDIYYENAIKMGL